MQRFVYHDVAIPSSDPPKAADQLSPHPAERFPHHDDADIPSSRQPIQVKPQNHYPHPHSPRRENPTKPWCRATIPPSSIGATRPHPTIQSHHHPTQIQGWDPHHAAGARLKAPPPCCRSWRRADILSTPSIIRSACIKSNPKCIAEPHAAKHHWQCSHATALPAEPGTRYTWSKERKKIELVIENERVKNEPSLAITHHGWSLFWDWNGAGEMLKRWTH